MDGIHGLDSPALNRARLSRDPRFDGKFFIAVTSTGIYCRPICPARSPNASNVRYFATAEAAAAAGFRPCLRCRPEAAPGTPAWLGTSAIVRRALRLIDDGVLDRGTVEALASQVGVGARHLHRLFVQHVGAAPIAVAQTRRLHFAKRLVDETGLPIARIAEAAGYGSVRRFNAAFRTTYDRAPREVRRRRHREAGMGQAVDVVLKLAFRPPYDWQHIRAFLATRAVPGVERVDERGYARTIALPDGHATVCVNLLEGEHALALRVSGAPSSTLFRLSALARRAFDLAADPASIADVFIGDPVLGPLVMRRPGLRVPGVWDPFECAVRATLGQQVSVAAARTLAARLVVRTGQPIAHGSDGLTHVFPSPTVLASADLDGLGLTGARVHAVRALARAVADGRVDFTRPADHVVSAITALPGFGPWTAQYIALRALSEPDAFPAGDLVLRRVAAAGREPLTERQLEARAEAWRPWRAYATLHLWAGAGDEPRRPDSRPAAHPRRSVSDGSIEQARRAGSQADRPPMRASRTMPTT